LAVRWTGRRHFFNVKPNGDYLTVATRAPRTTSCYDVNNGVRKFLQGGTDLVPLSSARGTRSRSACADGTKAWLDDKLMLDYHARQPVSGKIRRCAKNRQLTEFDDFTVRQRKVMTMRYRNRGCWLPVARRRQRGAFR